MLGRSRIVSFVTTTRPDAARSFYGDVLRLRFVREEPRALVFRGDGFLLRVGVVDAVTPPAGTALGWLVSDIEGAVETLAARGVRFEQYDGMPQDPRGIATFENGDRVAWFEDPDGNVLSLTEPHDAAEPGERPPGGTGHPVVQFEIGCPDADVSRRFFEAVFGWSASEYGPVAFRLDTGSRRGIQGFTTALGHEPHSYVNLYIETDDIASTIRRIEEHGGSVVVPENRAPGGRFCWFRDPSGNVLALWSPGVD